MNFADLFRTYGTMKHEQMNYGPIYDLILGGRVIKTILEIGVKEGYSLLAWAEAYPEAKIYGMDITLAKVDAFAREHPRIHLIAGDSTDPGIAPAFLQYDLIVDDGSHRLSDQLATLRTYAMDLTPSGIYVIEDIDSDENMNALCSAARDMNLEARRYYSQAAPGILDNRLVVIEP